MDEPKGLATATSYEDALDRIREGSVEAEAAAEALLDELTAEERLGLLDGDVDIEQGLPEMDEAYNTEPVVAAAVPRLGIPGIRFTDGPRGVVMGHSTCFPAAAARGASWDVELEFEVGRAIGLEARAQGANLFAGVCINLLRHPGWGRAQETYGEDPVLLGQLGAALTRGVREQVMTCVKHYALNSIENSRMRVDVEVDEEALHEVYLPHFRAVIDAGADAVMSAYNKVNGEWAGHNRILLTDILRGEWGFAGFVMCDFINGIRNGRESLEAGLDLEMPFRNIRARELPAEQAEGRLDDRDVGAAGIRILATMMRQQAALVDDPPPEAVVACPAHRELARRAATQGMVLLRNEPVEGAPLLPLDPGTASIAVLGALSDVATIGDLGSSAVRPPSTVTALAGIRASFPGAAVSADDGGDIARTAEAAASAAVAIVVVGLTADDEGEAHDRSALGLHRHDEEVIAAVAAANPRTVVVLIGGGPVVIEAWRDRVPAVLMAWYPGMEGGHALGDVLTGAAEPGGRLPAVVPTDPAHLPPFDNDAERVTYDRWWGQRKLDRDGHPAAYPLGFGLGYTSFALGDLTVEEPGGAGSGREVGPVRARVTVANTGARDGATIVQLYAVADEPARAGRPRRELLGFARVALPAGEQAETEIQASLKPLMRRDPADRRWSLVGGTYRLEAAQYWGDPAAAGAPLALSTARSSPAV